MTRKVSWKSCALWTATLLVAVAFAGTSQAQTYSLLAGSGGQAQIGGGLPLPIQLATTGGTMMQPIGTGTMFPPLLIPPRPGATVMQSPGAMAGDPMKLTVPPNVLRRIPAGPMTVGVAPNNPMVFQVKTALTYIAPGNFAATMTRIFQKGGRTGAAVTTFTGTPAGSIARYKATSNQFGGPAQSYVNPATPIKVWAHAGQMLPCKHPAFGGADAGCVAQLLAAYPGSMAAAGGMVGFITSTPGAPAPMSPNVVVVSIPNVTGMIAMSASAVMTGAATNMATSAGFPWTTGMLTLSQPTALGAPEKFVITGMDARNTMGVGTVSLVSGALSNRTLSGPNSNRSWTRYNLPEPAAVLGAGAALAVLGICHGLVRRRSR